MNAVNTSLLIHGRKNPLFVCQSYVTTVCTSVSVLDTVSQYLMLILLLSLSMGRELAGVSLQMSHHLHKLREKPTAKVVAGLAALQVSRNKSQAVWGLVRFQPAKDDIVVFH